MTDLWTSLQGLAEHPISTVEKALFLSAVTAASSSGTLMLRESLSLLEALGGGAIVGVLTLLAAMAFLRRPKAPKNTFGVLVAISPETEDYGNKLRSDFLQQLRRLVDSSPVETRITIVEYSARLSKTIIDREAATRALFDSRCQVAIFGEARSRSLRGRSQHVVTPRLIVHHRPITAEQSSRFGRALDRIFPQRIIIDAEGDFLGFALVSRLVLVAAQYAIAVAAALSLELDYAEELLERIATTVSDLPRGTPPVSYLRTATRRHLVRIRYLRAVEIYRRWEHSRDRDHLEEFEFHLKRVFELEPRHEGALLGKAITDFVLRRDIVSARRCIAKCKNSATGTWCYSDAFLNLYERRLKRARAAYRRAARMPTNELSDHIQSEIFIHEVLTEEPDRYWLWFGLGAINLFIKEDIAAAAEAFANFKNADVSNEFADYHVWAEGELANLRSRLDNQQGEEASDAP